VSYYGFGRGLGQIIPQASLPQTSVSATTQSGVTGLAVKAVVTDPSLPELSPFSVINLSYLQSTMSTALEAPLERVADAIISALPDALMSTIADVLGAVGQAIPLVGSVFQFVAGIVKIVDITSGWEAAAREEARARAASTCRSLLQDLAVQPSGGDLDPCQTCPTDIFFPIYPKTVESLMVLLSGNKPEPNNSRAYRDVGDGIAQPGSYWTIGGPNGELSYAFRPALGMALMRITEGSIFDPEEVALPNRADFEHFCNAELNTLKSAFGGVLAIASLKGGKLMSGQVVTVQDSVWWGQYGGLSTERRALFRAVRRGIQVASKYYGSLTDAGLSLWPVYMDLLLDAYDTGQLNDDFVAYVLGSQYLPATGGIWCGQAKTICGNIFPTSQDCSCTSEADNPCGYALARAIRKMVDSWRNTVQLPATKQGAIAIAQYRQTAAVIAAQVTAAAAGKAPPPPRFKYMHIDPKHRFVNLAPVPVKKAHPASALFGAGVAAAVIYFFL
jgi:hypothetical protein